MEETTHIKKALSCLLASRIDIYCDEDGTVLHVEPGTRLPWQDVELLIERMTEESFIKEVQEYNIQGIHLSKFGMETIDRASKIYFCYGLSTAAKEKLEGLILASGLFTDKLRGRASIRQFVEKNEQPCAIEPRDHNAFEDHRGENCPNPYHTICYILKDVERQSKLIYFDFYELVFGADQSIRFGLSIESEEDIENMIFLANSGELSMSALAKCFANSLDRAERFTKSHQERMAKLKPYIDCYERLDPSTKLLVELERNRYNEPTSGECQDGC